jgi:hypothetical protein
MATPENKSPHEEAANPVDLQTLLDQANERIAELENKLESASVIEPIMFPESDFEGYTAKALQNGTSIIDLVGDVMSYFKFYLGQRGFKMGLEGAIHNTESSGLERRTGQSHSAAFSLADPKAILHIDPRVTSWMQANNMFEAIYGQSTYTSKDEMAQRQANSNTGSIFASQLNSLSN